MSVGDDIILVRSPTTYVSINMFLKPQVYLNFSQQSENLVHLYLIIPPHQRMVIRQGDACSSSITQSGHLFGWNLFATLFESVPPEIIR